MKCDHLTIKRNTQQIVISDFDIRSESPQLPHKKPISPLNEKLKDIDEIKE